MSSSGPSNFPLAAIDPHRNGIDDVRVHQQSVQRSGNRFRTRFIIGSITAKEPRTRE
jgi:hypothetical protein